MSVIRRRSPVAADADLARSRRARRNGRRPTSWAALAMRGSLIVAGGTAALALAGPFALRPFADVAGAAGTAGEVTVAFVLDFGGHPDREVTGCVTVPGSDNGYQALAAFTAERGLAAPTYNDTGLLCSINGDPASGCGQGVPGGYIYWSYFTGSDNRWTYADVGASQSVAKYDMQGWRFQDPGTGEPNDPPPHTAPDHDALCSATGVTTTTTTPGAPAPGAAPTGKHHAHKAAKTKKVKKAKAAAGTRGSTCPTSSTITTSTTRPSIYPTTTTTLPANCTSTSSSTTSTYPPITTTTFPPISIPPDPDAGLASVSKHAPPGAGPDPLIVGGLLVGALAVAAYALWRRRTRLP
jgi:hypothetical protein